MDPIIASVTREFEDFTLSESGYEDEQDNALDGYCEHAKTFKLWADGLLAKYVNGSTDEIQLNQAKVLLIDRYFDTRAYAPRAHRDKIGDKGHFCLYYVFETAYNAIRMKQLALFPPKVHIVVREESTVPQVPIAQIPALFLGTTR